MQSIQIKTARQLLDLELQIEDGFSYIVGNRTGSLIIGTAPYRAASMLPAIAKPFQSLHQCMHMVLREATTRNLWKA